MKTNYLIAIKQLKSQNKIGFFTFSTLLSMIGLVLGVSSLLIISSITRGFNYNIETKLSDIDGHIRINNLFQSEISSIEAIRIQNKINKFQIASKAYPYVESHGMLRAGSKTDGVLIYGVENNAISDVFHLQNFIKTGDSNFNDENCIIIGNELANSLELYVGDEIILFNLDNVITNNSIVADKFKISGIFSTGFPEYDKLPVFIDIKRSQQLFNYSGYSGLIATINEIANIDRYSSLLNSKLPSNFQITTWKERHYQLISWLKIYDIPIKLLMFFITIIAIFNIAATLWMDVSNKTKEIGILRSIGFTKRDIKNIFLIKSFIIGVIGSIGGCVLGIFVLLLQQHFHIIEIPSSIYFMSYLPIKLDALDFIIISTLTVGFTILFSLIPSNLASKINPSIAVSYE